MLRSSKDKRDKLLSAGVYRIPCSCGKVYIGTTQWSVRTRLTEHNRNCRLGHIDKSAVAAHAYQEGDHNIRFKDMDILSTTTHFFSHLHREAIEIYKHDNNFNRKEEGVKVNKCWYPVLHRTDKPLQQKDGTQNRSSEQSGMDCSDNRPRSASCTINMPAQPATGSVASDDTSTLVTMEKCQMLAPLQCELVPLETQHLPVIIKQGGGKGQYKRPFPVAKASCNGWEDNRANHTIPPFWLDDLPPLLRHVGVRPAAGWLV
ncbi:hypothetical protein ANN_27196 [Periplaneta americana]|uniref:GIY-YIG domain-containing protein n=1 Tax=Periplaneta americana TaxID=6978 RepID=A0ABQ8RXK6_PERAM|nr:hypothetical protein ANN_27196 [Periplaneta americana]